MSSLRVLWVWVVLLMLGASCDDSRNRADRRSDAVGTASVPTPDLLLPQPYSDALSKLKAASGPDTQALRLEIYPARIVLQAQDPKQRGRLLQYEFVHGRLEAPEPVELRGAGDLAANLFALSNVNLDAVPALAEAAIAHVDREHGKVSQVLVRRNLPQSEDVQFRVYVDSPRKSGHVDADQTGKIF